MAVETKPRFLICQACDGTGVQPGKKCPSCQGVGAVLVLSDKILYYGDSFSAGHLALEKAIVSIRAFLNMALALFGLSGFLALAYYGYQNGFENFAQLSYWFTPSN